MMLHGLEDAKSKKRDQLLAQPEREDQVLAIGKKRSWAHG